MIELAELNELDQYAICKDLVEGKEPIYKDEKVKIPNVLSARYTCTNCDNVTIISFYLSDLKYLSKRIVCNKCRNWSIQHFIGSSMQHEVTKIKKSIQKRISDFL